MSNKANKKSKEFNVNEIYSDSAVRYNDYLLEYFQTSMAALSGCAAGVIGFTGLNGFLFYFACTIVLSILFVAYLGSNFKKYYINRQHVITGTLWSGMQTYLLFWTFLFGMVHVY
jgi:hypothetical protein